MGEEFSQALRSARIAYGRVLVDDKSVVVPLRDAERANEAKDIIKPLLEG